MILEDYKISAYRPPAEYGSHYHIGWLKDIEGVRGFMSAPIVKGDGPNGEFTLQAFSEILWPPYNKSIPEAFRRYVDAGYVIFPYNAYTKIDLFPDGHIQECLFIRYGITQAENV